MNPKKAVFIDTEFTGSHAYATLVSIGMTTLDKKEFYITLNDYNQNQVNGWLQENVLNHIDSRQSVNLKEAQNRVEKYFDEIRNGGQINLISAGKNQDICLLFELWHQKVPQEKYFNTRFLPDYLCHRSHFDLNTLLFGAGINPGGNRNQIIDFSISGQEHHALHDARVVRECFLKLKNEGHLTQPFLDLI